MGTSTAHGGGLDRQVACSTITLRHLGLTEALTTIAGLGFTSVDLGALPGVCEHVPAGLTSGDVDQVASVVDASGLEVRSVNADVGDLDRPLDAAGRADRDAHLDALLDLCVAVGTGGRPASLVLPNGGQRDTVDGPVPAGLDDALDRVAVELSTAAARAAVRAVELWVEAPHVLRLAHDLDLAAALLDRLPQDGPAPVGVVLDVSHVVASVGTPREFLARFGGRTRHVHLRDASPGYIHHSIGRGDVDFADLVRALDESGYDGSLSLELETRDVDDDARPAAALDAGRYISALLEQVAA